MPYVPNVYQPTRSSNAAVSTYRPTAGTTASPLQAKIDNSPRQVIQQKHVEALQKAVIQRRNNGLPDSLKTGIENLSGVSMDDVKVHYNSSKPAQLNAHAFAQGSDIHIAPGQERHLAHEAWHVVQQRQGRVRPTMQFGGMPVNDNVQLEREADVMGAQASLG